MPVLPNYYISHQWARELKRRGERTMVAIHFKLADNEPVWVGRYNEPHQQVTAGEAIRTIMVASDAQGYEIIVLRPIEKHEIHAMRAVPYGIGWRYMPGAHERKACLCPWCVRGDIKSQRLKRYYAKRDRSNTNP